jgi:hypothetical protein
MGVMGVWEGGVWGTGLVKDGVGALRLLAGWGDSYDM